MIMKMTGIKWVTAVSVSSLVQYLFLLRVT